MDQSIDRLRHACNMQADQYLRAAKYGYDPTQQELDCPYCRGTAHLLYGRFTCDDCQRDGDLIDLVRIDQGLTTDTAAIRHICRTVGIPYTHLDSLTVTELLAMDIKPTPFVVGELLPHGVTILAGAPKIGKSWMVLDLANCVSTGTPFLGHPTKSCDVLYVSLEDTLSRLHSRLTALGVDGNPHLHIATEAELLGNGLAEQLTSHKEAFPATALIIIDTLQLIRPIDGKKSRYDVDYATMCELRRLAQQLDVALLVVHHTRKMPDADPLNLISGTTGTTGGVDGNWVLIRDNRMSDHAVVHIISRDVESVEMSLLFSAETMRWEICNSLPLSLRTNDELVLTAISTLMKSCNTWSGTATELLQQLLSICPEIQMRANQLSATLHRIASPNLANLGISVHHSRDRQGKYIHLSLSRDDE